MAGDEEGPQTILETAGSHSINVEHYSLRILIIFKKETLISLTITTVLNLSFSS